MSGPTPEWWGASERDMESDAYIHDRPPVGPLPPVIKRKIPQRDGTTLPTDIAPTIEEYYERLSKPRRKRKRREPEFERITKVPEIVELWDEVRRDPFEPLGRIVRVPPDWVARPGEIVSDHPMDFVTAEGVRKARVPAAWLEQWNPAEYCISAIVGCTDPPTRKTPDRCCDRCYKFHLRHDSWPTRTDIQKRHARDARASKKSQGTPDE